MKISHKIIMASAAALLSLAPVLSETNSVLAAKTTDSKQTVKKTTKKTNNKKAIKKTTKKTVSKKATKKTTKKAAKKTTKTIRLTTSAYIYDSKGKINKKAGKLKKNSVIVYIGIKKIKGTSYFNLGKNQYVKVASAKKAKAGTTKTTTEADETYVQLVNNAIIYDQNGNAIDPTMYALRGSDYQALSAKKIGDMWYYQIGDTGSGQWIKATNACVISGKKIIQDPDYVEPKGITFPKTSIVTVNKYAQTYDKNGQIIENNTFEPGYSLRVSALVWIWVPADNQAEEFYKIASDNDNYIKVSDVNTISGTALTPSNTAQDAQMAHLYPDHKIPVADANNLSDTEISEIISACAAANNVPDSSVEMSSDHQLLKVTTKNGYTLNLSVSDYIK